MPTPFGSVIGSFESDGASRPPPYRQRTVSSWVLSHATMLSVAGDVGMLSDRTPKCANCRNHGRLVRSRGHKKDCPYRNCHCELCYWSIERRHIMGMQNTLEKRIASAQQAAREQLQPAAGPVDCGNAPGKCDCLAFSLNPFVFVVQCCCCRRCSCSGCRSNLMSSNPG